MTTAYKNAYREVRLQVLDHPVTRIAVHAQVVVVIIDGANTVDDLLFGEACEQSQATATQRA